MIEELSADPARTALLLAGLSMIVSLTVALYVFVMAGAKSREESENLVSGEESSAAPSGTQQQPSGQPLVLDTKLRQITHSSPNDDGSMRRYV